MQYFYCTIVLIIPHKLNHSTTSKELLGPSGCMLCSDWKKICHENHTQLFWIWERFGFFFLRPQEQQLHKFTSFPPRNFFFTFELLNRRWCRAGLTLANLCVLIWKFGFLPLFTVTVKPLSQLFMLALRAKWNITKQDVIFFFFYNKKMERHYLTLVLSISSFSHLRAIKTSSTFILWL